MDAKATKVQANEMLSWVLLRQGDKDTKPLIVFWLIDRVDVRAGYEVHTKFKISRKQFLGRE